MTAARRRSGTAHVIWKPASEARRAKSGQRVRLPTAVGSTGWSVENALHRSVVNLTADLSAG